MGLATFLSVATSCYKKPELPKQSVLVIHSYGATHDAYQSFIEDCYAQNATLQQYPLRLKHVYLNQPNLLDEVSEHLLYDTLQAIQRRGEMPDLVITHNDDALSMYLHQILKVKEFQRIPLVYTGVLTTFSHLQDTAYRRISATGFVDKLHLVENLDFLRELFGGNGSCMIELDSTEVDCAMREEIHATLENADNYIDNCDLHLDEQESMRLINDTSNKKGIIFFISMEHPSSNYKSKKFMDEASREFMSRDYVEETMRNAKYMKQLQVNYSNYSNIVIEHSRRPQLSSINAQFGYSNPIRILGGYFSSMQTQVDDALLYAKAILKDSVDVKNLKQGTNTPDWYLDYKAMKQWGIKMNAVDSRINIINKPSGSNIPESYDLDSVGVMLAAIIIVCFIILGMFFAFLILLKRHRVHTQELIEWMMDGGKSAFWTFQNGEFYLSRRLKVLSGYNRDSITKQEFLSLVHPSQKEFAESCINFDTPDGQYSHRFQLRSQSTDEYHWYLFSYTLNAVSNSNNVIEGFATNIDAEVKQEKDLQKSLQVAEETKLKEAFLANMTHDIRSPLSTIVSFVDMLVSDGMSLPAEERAVFVEQISQSTNVMLTLLDDIVDVSRMQLSEYRFMNAKTPVKSIVEQAYMSNKVLMPSHIVFNIERHTEVNVFVDPARLAQVLNNFLSNAIKNTPEGSITIGWRMHDFKVDIYVRDTGVGISPERQQVIFEKFSKFDGQSGAGLGLNICKTIVEKQGGVISVESELGKGSTFMVTFPLG